MSVPSNLNVFLQISIETHTNIETLGKTRQTISLGSRHYISVNCNLGINLVNVVVATFCMFKEAPYSFQYISVFKLKAI